MIYYNIYKYIYNIYIYEFQYEKDRKLLSSKEKQTSIKSLATSLTRTIPPRTYVAHLLERYGHLDHACPQNNPKHRLSILPQPKTPMTTRLNWQVATNIFVRVGAPEVLSKFLQTFPRHQVQSDSRLKRFQWFQSLQASLKAQIYRITLACCVWHVFKH